MGHLCAGCDEAIKFDGSSKICDGCSESWHEECARMDGVYTENDVTLCESCFRSRRDELRDLDGDSA